jgi:hypothetical protein
MAALRTEYSTLLLFDPDKSRSTVHCYHSSPTPLEERTMGRLFLVVEIDAPDPQNQHIIHELQNVLTREYYGAENFQVESAFERALQKINEHLHGMIGEQLTTWLQSLNILIAVLKDTDLHFTVIGRMHAFLVHRQRILDILDSPAGAATEATSPLKIFTNIISGRLNFGDTLFICTTSLLDHLSQEKLKRVLHERPPAGASQHLESLLIEAEGSSSFGAFIIRLSPANEPALHEDENHILAEQRPVTPQQQDSMEKLIAREQATNTLLTHSLWLNLGRLIKSGSRVLRSSIQRGPDRTPQEEDEHAAPEAPAPAAPVRPMTPPSSPGATVGRVLLAIFRGLISLLRLLAVGLLRGVQLLLGAFRKPGWRSQAQRFPRSTNQGIARGSRWFQRLSPARKRLLLVAVVLILIFAQSIVSRGNSRETKQRTDQYLAFVRTANEKIAAADAALLIKNESGARALLLEANEALAAIPNTKNSPKDEIGAARAKIETKLESIRHVISVTPESLSDLAGLEVEFAASSLLINGDAAYTFSTRSSSVYRISLEEKKVESVLETPSLEHPLVRFLHGETPSVYLLQSNGALQVFDTKKPSLATAAVQYENVDRNIVDAAVYNGRLYTLDAQNNQIFRHDRAGTGFGIGQSWVKATDLDLKDGVSIAVDGSVYVLKANGIIVKMSAGQQSTAAFDAIDPQLTQPKRLITDSDTLLVYLLDPAERRIVEFTKEGKFLQQYRSDSLATAQDCVIRGGFVYVVTTTQLLRFPLSERPS